MACCKFMHVGTKGKAVGNVLNSVVLRWWLFKCQTICNRIAPTKSQQTLAEKKQQPSLQMRDTGQAAGSPSCGQKNNWLFLFHTPPDWKVSLYQMEQEGKEWTLNMYISFGAVFKFPHDTPRQLLVILAHCKIAWKAV